MEVRRKDGDGKKISKGPNFVSPILRPGSWIVSATCAVDCDVHCSSGSESKVIGASQFGIRRHSIITTDSGRLLLALIASFSFAC